MALRVTIAGVPWLVDAGFGSSVPPAPLRLDTRDPQPTRYGRHRVIPLGSGQLVQAEVAGVWLPLYDLSSEPLLATQFELFNWYASTHDKSHFRHRLIVARTTPEARFSLMDGRFSVRFADGRIERQFLDADGIRRVIEESFLLRPDRSWDAAFEEAAARTDLQERSSTVLSGRRAD
jgi:N-hydroxyarylamine O-acetyltransferase